MTKKHCIETLLEAVRFHPFFQGVEHDTALSLIRKCEQRVYQKREVMLTKNKESSGLMLMLSGLAEVYVTNGNYEEVLEVVQKGGMIGFSGLADFLGAGGALKNDVRVDVRAVEDVQALFIPFEVIARRWDDPNVHDYLLTKVAARLRDIYASLAEQVKLARDFGENTAFMLRVQDVMTEGVVSVLPKTPVQEAARKMADRRTSSVLVVDGGKLQGIITERDIVERVVAGNKPLSAYASEIMTSGLTTISRFAYYYEALSVILLKGIKHLPVLEGEKPVGIVTLSDLLRKKNENMIKTIQRIEEAGEDSLSQIKQAIYDVVDTLVRDRVPVLNTLDIVTKLYDRLVIRAIALSVNRLAAKGHKLPGPFAFYQMGSSGRGEQFILTDQDHFLVYAGPSAAESYFAELGVEITASLEAAGYARCKGLMMACEADWRGSIQQWRERLRHWMIESTNDNLLLAQNFFSFRFVYGSKQLNGQFEASIDELLLRSKIFLYRLAQAERESSIPALDQPIRSLFGFRRKSLDMKKEVLFPFHHCLQILALLHREITGTPLEKIKALHEQGVLSSQLTRDLQEALRSILSLYVRHRWQQVKKGVEPSSSLSFAGLSTREKEELMMSLRTFRELQHHVLAHFTL
nr:DUF294 nucleotidyltransferase-like domain-containing protein [Evansella caseinilytica]